MTIEKLFILLRIAITIEKSFVKKDFTYWAKKEDIIYEKCSRKLLPSKH